MGGCGCTVWPMRTTVGSMTVLFDHAVLLIVIVYCRCVPLQATCAELDANEEVLECCLSFLQADPVEPYLVALPNAAATIDVRFHK